MWVSFKITDIPENNTIEVVNVVMNNIENYLPRNVVEEDKEL